jgi:hypothetical protein
MGNDAARGLVVATRASLAMLLTLCLRAFGQGYRFRRGCSSTFCSHSRLPLL